MQGTLILGSTGAVGRALARVWPVGVSAVWQHRPGALAPAAPAVAWDILNAPAPDLTGITGIVQLAGGAADLDVIMPLALAACDLGERLNVPVLIASTQAVYGPVPGAVTEATLCNPSNDYGRAKRAMELAVQGRATCLRIGNVVGCDMLLKNAAKGRVTLDQLPGGGSPERSYISAPVLGQVIRALLAQDTRPDVINVAQPGAVAMHDLLAAAGLAWDWRPAPDGVLASLALDVTLLQGVLDIAPATAADLIADAKAAGWAA